MWDVKSELEGRSLAILEPHAYETIHAELERLERHQSPRFETVRVQIENRLREAGLPAREIKMAPENVYTVYQDLVKHGMGYRDVDRHLRLTVLMEDPIDCYTALGESVARLTLVGGKAQPVGHLNRAARLIEMGLQ